MNAVDVSIYVTYVFYILYLSAGRSHIWHQLVALAAGECSDVSIYVVHVFYVYIAAGRSHIWHQLVSLAADECG